MFYYASLPIKIRTQLYSNLFMITDVITRFHTSDIPKNMYNINKYKKSYSTKITTITKLTASNYPSPMKRSSSMKRTYSSRLESSCFIRPFPTDIFLRLIFSYQLDHPAALERDKNS